ncbi:MAG: 2-amino-4-hydroxy-6-hydroxymethyldihydropteridine diphosphokinase [Chitinispirillales bacterium]|jgi:2-amino-4-hydroxy-6-hydroxymethyldihydropteridine diphosphokinase|nr:2-amino-4-hydroxy-6-hydroxymethyldihydropteridine diphosphokinase [Chitinispirillales bacterium]
MEFVVLSIGSNLGEREKFISAMELELSSLLIEVKKSSLMETEPVGMSGSQLAFLNRLIAGYYNGNPHQLLESCLAIESRLGRKRLVSGSGKTKNSRTADVDILIFGNLEINCADITVPHPQIVNRRFCLEGLCQIDSGLVVSGTGKSARQLCEEMNAKIKAQKIIFMS